MIEVVGFGFDIEVVEEFWVENFGELVEVENLFWSGVILVFVIVWYCVDFVFFNGFYVFLCGVV